MRAVFKDVLGILAIIFCLLNQVALKQADAQCNDPDNPMISEIDVLKVEARTAILEKAEELGVTVNNDIHFAYSGECTHAQDFTFLANAAVNSSSEKKTAGIVYLESEECKSLNGVFTVEIKMKDGKPVSADLMSDGLKINNLPVEIDDPTFPNTPGSSIGFRTFKVQDIPVGVKKEARLIPCLWCSSITLTYTNFAGYLIRIILR